MDVRARLFGALAVALLACATARAAAQGASAATMKTVDTGLGMTISVPETWTRGEPIKNNKFVMGAGDDDFSVLVADFGPAQGDAAAAADVYRESFLRNGLSPVTETDATVGGRSVKRFVLRLETPDGPGHAEAVMVQIGDEMYAVVVVTPEASAEARRETIARILESVTVR